jgi:DNA polymerase III delta prime subunit
MEIFEGLIGNEDIKNTLGNAINNSEFLHAYIIEGPYGTGKHTTALLSAAAVFCRNRDKDGLPLPCGECESCRKVLRGMSVDIIYAEPGASVDDIRALRQGMYEAPNENDYKIYVLPDAHDMTVNAQNSLLKSLEEPPPHVMFFLLCDDAEALLETIRSRAPVLRTEVLPDTLLREVLLKQEPKAGELARKDPMKFEEIILFSNGSLGMAKDSLDPKKSERILKLREEAKTTAAALLRGDAQAYELAARLTGYTREALKELLPSVQAALRDAAVIKRDPDAKLCFFASRDAASDAAGTADLYRILAACDAVATAISDVKRNAAVPSLVLNLFLSAQE